MAAKKVGVIGCGTIGRELAIAIDTGAVQNSSLVSLFDVVEGNAQSLRAKLGSSQPLTFSSFEEFIKTDCKLVAEAASQEAVRRFASQILQAGKDLMVMSVGALADETLLTQLLKEAAKNDCRLYVPTGAIAGIDAIKAVRHLLDTVILTTTKHPKALAGAPFFETSKFKINEINERTLIYEGSASNAVKAFPANVNVAAVLSLAGIGVDRTKVRIVADPSFATNQHEITAKGSFGEFHFTVNNVPTPGNPKTSYLAVLSAIECLRSICEEGIRIGS
jgi:aspartate dehydrogenase